MLAIIIICVVSVYLFFKWNHYTRYTRYGLRGPAWIPILGNFFSVRWRPFKEYEQENFKKYGRVYVDYVFNSLGCITTSDPEHIKKILIKDFPLFYYRVQPNYLPKYGRKVLIFINGADWKRIRSQITPVFTSGRLRQMYINFDPAIKNCLANIDELIEKKQNENVEVKYLMRSFALDIIGNVVFSLKTNAFKDDEFSKNVSDLFNPNLPLVALSFFILPSKVCEFFDLSLFNSKTLKYISKLTLTLIEERKKQKGVVYNDFIELLMKQQSEESNIDNTMADGHINKKLTTEEVVAAAFVFFLAGQETISTALVHVLLELALNPEVQDKLYKDLMTNYASDEISYDDVNKKSTYLDCVVNEVLRMHNSLNRMFRVAQSDYDFGDFKIKKGQMVGVEVSNLHRDPEIFPEPNRFRPERFENGEVDMSCFIPFGDGSRNCVASRFAILELKSITVHLVKKFKILPNENTLPVKYRNAIIVNFVDDMRLRFERR